MDARDKAEIEMLQKLAEVIDLAKDADVSYKMIENLEKIWDKLNEGRKTKETIKKTRKTSEKKKELQKREK